MDRGRPFAAGALFAAGVATFGVFAGFFGSLHGEKIKSAFPFCHIECSGPVVPEAAIFWALLLGAGVLYWRRQIAVEGERQKASDALYERAGELEELFRTLWRTAKALPTTTWTQGRWRTSAGMRETSPVA